MRNLKPAHPGPDIQKALQKTTTAFFQDICEDMRAHYRNILAKTASEVARLSPSNTALQKSSQVALTWERSKNRKLDSKTVHTFRTWVKDIEGFIDPDSLDNLMKAPEATAFQKVTKKSATRTTQPPPVQVNNRFQALLEEDTTFQEAVQNTTISSQDQRAAGPSSSTTKTAPAPEPAAPASSLYDPDLPSVNAQGPADPLSNFYMATVTFRGENFLSNEHAYQTIKATFMGNLAIAQDIMVSPTASRAKELSRCLDNHPKVKQWDMEKEQLMADLLWAKAEQCPVFREKLNNTARRRITHRVPHSFWGTTCTNSKGKTIVGKDKFGILLMRLREKIQPLPPRPEPSPRKPKKQQRPATYAQAVISPPPTPGKRKDRPTTPPPSPQKKQKTGTPPPRMPNLEDTAATTATTENQSTPPATQRPQPRSPTPPPKTPPPRRPRTDHQLSPSEGRASPVASEGSLALLEQMDTTSDADAASQHSDDISETALDTRIQEETPAQDQPTSKTVNQMIDYFSSIHQDSTHIASSTGSILQILRPGQVPPFERPILVLGDSNVKHIQESPKDLPVQLVSYSGATINSFHRAILKKYKPSDVPKVVIISVGICNMNSMKVSHCRQELVRLANALQKQFPKASLYMPQINFTLHHESYDTINTQLEHPPSNLTVIPPLPRKNYFTRADRIHWTLKTGRDMLAHWAQFITVPHCVSSGGLPP